jgi:hypothetical protein
VDALDWAWQYGMPLLGLATGVGALAVAVGTRPSELPDPRAYWPFALVLLMWTGDAAVGDGRPLLERLGKGVAAALIWVSVAVVLWRRRRHQSAARVESS